MVEMKDSTEEDWEWTKDVGDSDINETLILFDPPLDLKQQKILCHILEKLHKNGVKYSTHWDRSYGMPIMKYKLRQTFGKLRNLPIFYRHDELHDTKGELHYLMVDHNKVMEVGTSPLSERWGYLELTYKTFNAYELLF